MCNISTKNMVDIITNKVKSNNEILLLTNTFINYFNSKLFYIQLYTYKQNNGLAMGVPL